MSQNSRECTILLVIKKIQGKYPNRQWRKEDQNLTTKIEAKSELPNINNKK